MARLTFLLILSILFSKLVQSHEIDSLMHVLEQNMQNKKLYEAKKTQQINKIKELKNEEGIDYMQIFIINQRLFKEYDAFNFDSALYYLKTNIKIARALNKSNLLIQTKISLVNILANSGHYKDAEEILFSINRKSIPDALLPNYYASCRTIYSILDFYTKIDQNQKKYHKNYQLYTDSLLFVVDTNSAMYHSITETIYREKKNGKACLKINTKRLSMVHSGEREYSMITFERVLAYRLLNDTINQKKYLILSAISDIQSAVKDNASLTILANLLYLEGNIKQAHKFINFAFEDAKFYNSRLRFTLISDILPIINDAYKLKSEKQQKILWSLLLIISLLSVILITVVIKLYKHAATLSETQKQLKQVNQSLSELNSELNSVNYKLQESNQVKDHYIGNFLFICSEYIDKLDKFRNMVNKHLLKKQAQELFSKTKSTELIEEETKEFYDNFDRIFLHIFPNFVSNINSLLHPNERITLKDDEKLNTELRIFALVRLGITDSHKIATLLRYSIRTIYNYRVKIKNKAINHDNFEQMIMNFGINQK